jgi:hypothetical protein
MVLRKLRDNTLIKDMRIPCRSEADSLHEFEGMTAYDPITFEYLIYTNGKWEPENKGITINDL